MITTLTIVTNLEYCLGYLIVAYALHCFLPLSYAIRDEPNGSIFNVIDYGAKGDGKQDASQAFSKAWNDVCRATGNPTLLVPTGQTFLMSPLSFQGPCKSTSVHVEIQGRIVAPETMEGWKGCIKSGWLLFQDVDNLCIDGSGEINGRGSIWWRNADQRCDRPTSLEFKHCKGLRLSGITMRDSPKGHLSFSHCDGSVVSNLHIMAPENSPNTDGIDICQCTNFQILDSNIQTGDDCIAIGSRTSWLNISGVNCGPGHGISIGSLGKDGEEAMVEQVHVRNCTFTKASNGARIKTWQGGSGYARSITFESITLIDVSYPIVIDQYYCGGAHGCPIKKSAVEISKVRYTGFQGTSATETAITLNCSNTVGCNDVVMESVNITSSTPSQKVISVCNNAQGAATKVSPQVPCLR